VPLLEGAMDILRTGAAEVENLDLLIVVRVEELRASSCPLTLKASSAGSIFETDFGASHKPFHDRETKQPLRHLLALQIATQVLTGARSPQTNQSAAGVRSKYEIFRPGLHGTQPH
jgi:hypothetical protein